MIDKKNNLRKILFELFQDLGMFAQANYVQNNNQLKNLDFTTLLTQLRKHQLPHSTIPFSKSALSTTNFPFIILDNDGTATLAKRSKSKFLCFDEQGQWTEYNLNKKHINANVIIIDSLPLEKQNLKSFTKQMNKRTKWYKPVFWLSLLSSIAGLSVPLFTMSVYDRVIGGQAPDVLPKIALGACLALAILVSTRMMRGKILSSVSNRFARDLSDITFSRLLFLPLLILSRVGLSNHIARMRNAEKIRNLFSGPSGAGLVDVPFTLIAFATIVFLSGWLVLVPIVMIILTTLINNLINRYVEAASPTLTSQYQNSLNELSSSILQLQASGNTQSWSREFFRMTREVCRQNFIFAKRNGLNAAIGHSLSSLTVLATVFTGIFLVLEQEISAGALIGCVMLIGRITGPVQIALSSRKKITMLQGSIKQFDRFMETKPENSELRLTELNEKVAPAISFKHITLRYTADLEPALSDISVDIEPGECAAVIGPNGCGKTSLLLIALGVIEPQSGFVTVNSNHLKQFDPQQFRQFTGYAAAESELLEGTLRENLKIMNPDATDEQLIKALKMAGAEDFFKTLDNNLDTNLNDRINNTLSTIEANYISLARTLIKKPPYLILDEPLANRNPKAKTAFIDTLISLKGKSTVLFSSHDPDLIKLADKVIILDKGKLVFAGPAPDNAQSTEE